MNPNYNVKRLEIGDIAITEQGNEIVTDIIVLQTDTDEGFEGYDIHFREGYNSYYANGVLVLLNYPDITINGILQRLSDLSLESQKEFAAFITKNPEIFNKILGKSAFEHLFDRIVSYDGEVMTSR